MFRALAKNIPLVRSSINARFFASQTFISVEEVTPRMMDMMKKFETVDAKKVTPVASFVNDLKLDSLGIVEVIMGIEDEFSIEIPDEKAEKITSIADAIKYVSENPFSK